MLPSSNRLILFHFSFARKAEFKTGGKREGERSTGPAHRRSRLESSRSRRRVSGSRKRDPEKGIRDRVEKTEVRDGKGNNPSQGPML